MQTRSRRGSIYQPHHALLFAYVGACACLHCATRLISPSDQIRTMHSLALLCPQACPDSPNPHLVIAVFCAVRAV